MKLKDSDIINMIQELLKEVDYDTWKGIFVHPEGDSTEQIEILVKIVRKYLK